MSDKTITVFTPTYNRGYILPNLYNSLVNQTYKNFVWLIVDDGSTDNTKVMVEEWTKEGKIDIEYYYQENQGKQIAMNLGAEKCNTELFDTVDSDDYMTPNALKNIVDFWNKHKADNYAGIISLRGKTETKSLTGSYMPKGVEHCKYRALYEEYGFVGDSNQIYRTDVIRKYPYQLFPNEKFIAETAQFLQIDDHYDMLLLNDISVICEYREDGYSKNVKKLLKNNPLGYRYIKDLNYRHSKTLKGKFAEMIKYCCANFMCHDGQGYKLAANKPMYLLCFIPGALCYLIFYKKA